MRYIRFTILTLVLMAIALGACGRRGPLEPPPGDPAPAKSDFLLDKLV